MKESMSSVDVAAIVTELQELVGARLVKAYQPGKEEIRLKLHQKEIGSLDLIIEAGRRIHLTKYKRPSPRMPSNFSMYIRKHLSGGRIAQIRQLEFDRIVELTVERWDKQLRLIAELLPRGNLVLIDENGDIMLPLRRKSFATRELKVRKKYERPPSRENPLAINELEFENLCKSAARDKDIVRVLASELSLGGLYAEEVCEIAGVAKNKNANELKETELKSIHEALRTLFEPILTHDKSELKPHIVLEAQEKLDVLPFELDAYKAKEKEFFASFNDAADEFFTTQIAEAVEEQAKIEHEKGISKYERVLNEQLDALKKFERKEAEWIEKGELIYARYVEIEAILREMPKKRKLVTVTLPNSDLPLEIDTTASLNKNASAYYERAKVFRKKREGVEHAMEETKARIQVEKEKELEIKEELIPERREEVIRVKEEWYEKFRWFETTDGFLVIGGKDATTNEILVKKYMDHKDLFCHTQAEGAPVVIAKTAGKEISEDSLKEIAQFATSYSNLWKYGFYEGECYCVAGEQVSKTPPSGEYIKKGAFMVRGKRKYFKAPLGLCIGVKQNKLVAVPSTDTQKQQMEMYVELEPEGELEKNELAKEIVKIFVEHAKEDKKEDVKRIASYEKVLRYLPPGKSRMKGGYPRG
jgi:predicted ribosome quality control (RQC) complex YloA/Tae2 family protein